MVPQKHSMGLLVKIGICVVLFASGTSVGNAVQLPSIEIDSSLPRKAMPELGESQLARILSRYYNIGLGGLKTWEQINSLKITGTLTLAEGPLKLYAYQRKPNLFKLTLCRGEFEMVLGYDGETAWRIKPGQSPEHMPAKQARSFIHNSIFGNYLLYPHTNGKKIEYIGTVTVDKEHCHHIRVQLNNDYQVDYFFSVSSYLDVKVIHTDLQSGSTNSIFYRDYIRVSGIPISTYSQNYEGDKWQSTLRIEDVKHNLGLTPWIFRIPKLAE